MKLQILIFLIAFVQTLLFIENNLAQPSLNEISISFSVSPTSLNYANNIFRNGDHANIPIQWRGIAPEIQKAKRSITSASLQDAKAWHDTMFNNFEIFTYNIEHWPYTPENEQIDPVSATKDAYQFAKLKKMLFTIAPDRRFANSHGEEMASFADIFGLQMQRLQHDIKMFSDTLRLLTSRIKSKNPLINIWVQIGAQVAGENRSVNEMIIAADTARKYADGLVIFYGSNFDTLKTFIERIRGVTSADFSNDVIPETIMLFQNYPNPFNPTTTIKYSIPSVETRHQPRQDRVLTGGASLQYVTLKIYDVLGREVATLVNEFKQPGIYVETFHPVKNTEQVGTSLPSGVYFCRLIAGSISNTIKMIYQK